MLDGVFPDLVGLGSEIDFGVVVAVEDPGLLGKEIADGLLVGLILEKGFVAADHFGVLAEAVAHAGAQADDAFDAVGGEERVAEDLLRLLPDTIHATGPLDESNDGPRQVIVDDDGAVLKVLAFAEDIGRDQDAQFVLRLDTIASCCC